MAIRGVNGIFSGSARGDPVLIRAALPDSFGPAAYISKHENLLTAGSGLHRADSSSAREFVPGANVTAEEIQKMATAAGFEPEASDSSTRLSFDRGPYTLVVDADATWTCYTDVTGCRKVFRKRIHLRFIVGFST